jgi:5-methylcytosine-specific restriction endonuclease McrA
MARTRTARELAYRGSWPKLSKFVIARDRGICHICGLPGADTADHLDPVAERGPGLPPPDRLKAAHRACNTRRARLREKQARAPERSA